MKRLKSVLCNFSIPFFSASAGSLFTQTVISHNVNYFISGIAMASVCAIICVKYLNIEKEEGEANKEEK